MQYIALRPRVEKQGEHGLFTQEDTPIVLDRIANEVAFHDGIVWRTIISLKREDATRLGYDNADAWKKLLRSQATNLAKSMGIPLSDLRWYAAFHNEGHHPHVHLVSYSVGKKPYLTQEQLIKMKQNYADEIFKNDLMDTYKRQTVDRDELRKLAKERLQEIIAQINGGNFENERIEQLLVELAQRIDRAGNTSSVYTVTLDRQIPTAQLYVDGNPIDNHSYTNGAHISFECEETCYVKLPDSDTFVEYLSGAEYYKPGKYVFYGLSDAGNSTGYYTLIIDRNYVTNHFAVLLRQHGLEKIRFHDLRHSCATLMLSNGEDLKKIQGWLGHSTITITADTYAHLDAHSKRGSASVIENALSLCS